MPENNTKGDNRERHTAWERDRTRKGERDRLGLGCNRRSRGSLAGSHGFRNSRRTCCRVRCGGAGLQKQQEGRRRGTLVALALETEIEETNRSVPVRVRGDEKLPALSFGSAGDTTEAGDT